MLTREQILSQLEQKKEDELVEIHNNYCEATNNMENYIYQNTEENLRMLLPSDPVSAFYTGRICSEQYSPSDEYLQLDGYANLKSCSDPVDCFLFLSDLARWMENDEYLQEDYLDVESEEKDE